MRVFVSYTKHDKQWAEWIGQRLGEFGHTAYVHDWEPITDIGAWMEERLKQADMVLCVVSRQYLEAPFSSWERRAAQWAVTLGREGFLRLVFVEDAEPPLLLAPINRCSLYGLDEAAAKEALAEYLKPAAPPAHPIMYPGVAKAPLVPFPGR